MWANGEVLALRMQLAMPALTLDQFCDVVVEAESETMPCHSVVLAATSEHFADAFRVSHTFLRHFLTFVADAM